MPYHTTHGEGCGLLHQGCPPAVLSFPLGRYCEGHLPYAWARLNCHLVSRFCNLRGFPCLSVRGRIAFPSYNPATSSRFMLLHRGNSRLNGRGAFPYRQRVPRSFYCWKSAVGAFRFSYEEERLGSVLWRIHPSGLDGLGACPFVRPGSEGAAGAASGSGASYCDPYSGIQQDGSGGSPPAPRLGMKSGNPLRQAVCGKP